LGILDFISASSAAVPAQRLNTVADIAPALEAAIASRGRSILEILIG
jgi:hypothetical protein